MPLATETSVRCVYLPVQYLPVRVRLTDTRGWCVSQTLGGAACALTFPIVRDLMHYSPRTGFCTTSESGEVV